MTFDELLDRFSITFLVVVIASLIGFVGGLIFARWRKPRTSPNRNGIEENEQQKTRNEILRDHILNDTGSSASFSVTIPLPTRKK